MREADRFRPVGRATPVVEATIGALAAAVLGAASAVRRARVFHPDGVGFEATLHVTGAGLGVPLLDEPRRHPAVVRLSRGIGLPERWSDILGLAVRIVDAHGDGRHQDLLLVTSGSAPVLRHAFVPARGFHHGRWSSLVPYRIGGTTMVFGAHRFGTTGIEEPNLSDLRDRGTGLGLRFSLDVAVPRGPWSSVGHLELGDVLDPAASEDLAFDPSNSARGIEPVGVVQAARRLAYRTSQMARPEGQRSERSPARR